MTARTSRIPERFLAFASPETLDAELAMCGQAPRAAGESDQDVWQRLTIPERVVPAACLTTVELLMGRPLTPLERTVLDLTSTWYREDAAKRGGA